MVLPPLCLGTALSKLTFLTIGQVRKKVKPHKFPPPPSFFWYTSKYFCTYSCISQLLPLYFYSTWWRWSLNPQLSNWVVFFVATGGRPERWQVFVSIRITTCWVTTVPHAIYPLVLPPHSLSLANTSLHAPLAPAIGRGERYKWIARLLPPKGKMRFRLQKQKDLHPVFLPLPDMVQSSNGSVGNESSLVWFSPRDIIGCI